LTDKVKAVIFSEPGKMHISRFDRPEVDENSVLLKVEMVGVCELTFISLKVICRVYRFL